MKKEFQGPPQLQGLNIGCRTAVILTPEELNARLVFEELFIGYRDLFALHRA